MTNGSGLPKPRRHDPFGEPMAVEEIQPKSARNFAVTALAKAGVQTLRLVTMLVLARLLAPADFGVLAMVMSAIGIAELFRDLGLSAATVRLPTITPTQVNTLFWINSAFGTLMMGAIWLAAPWLSVLLADDRVAGVAAALACSFLINGLAAQHVALLRRSLRFDELAGISLVAAAAGSLVALTLAVAGAEYWSLVCAALVSNLITLVIAWVRSGWHPSMPAYDPTVRPMLTFGGYLVGFGFLTYLAHNLHIVLIGRMWGAASAGLYSRAALLLNQPLGYLLEPLRAIAPATLSRLNGSPSAFRDYYVGTIALLMLVVAPFGVWLAMLAPDVVYLLLGSQWTGAETVLAWLSLSMVAQVLTVSTGWLYLSRGDSRGMMRWGILGWSIVIACMVLGLRWGLAGVAAMYSLSMYLILVPCLVHACRGTQITARELWFVAWRPMACSILTAMAVFLLMVRMNAWPAGVRVAATGVLFIGIYLLILTTVFGQREQIRSLWMQAISLVGSRNSR